MSHAVAIALAGVLFAITYLVGRRWIPAALVLAVIALCLGSAGYPWLQTGFLTARWGPVAALALLVLPGAWLRRPVRPVWLVAVAVAALSSLWSFDPRSTLMRAVAFGVVAWIGFVVTPTAFAHSPARFTRTMSVMFLGAAIAGLVLLLVVPDTAVSENNLRGFLGSPDQFGLLLAITFPYAFALLDRWPLWISAAAAVVPTAGAMLAASRSGVLAIAAAVGLWAIAKRDFLGLLVGAVAVASTVVVLTLLHLQLNPPPTYVVPFGAVVYMPGGVRPLPPGTLITMPLHRKPVAQPPPPKSATKPAVRLPDGSQIGRPVDQLQQMFGGRRPPGMSELTSLLGGRDEAWGAAIRLADRHPLGGYGFGTGERVFDRYPAITHFRFFAGATSKGTNPHSAYFQALLELGYLGGALFLLPLLVAAVAGARLVLRRRVATPVLAAAASLAAGLVGGGFESLFGSPGAPFTILIWSAAGIVLAAARSSMGARGYEALRRRAVPEGADERAIQER